jgi:hypothetical protein
VDIEKRKRLAEYEQAYEELEVCEELDLLILSTLDLGTVTALKIQILRWRRRWAGHLPAHALTDPGFRSYIRCLELGQLDTELIGRAATWGQSYMPATLARWLAYTRASSALSTANSAS